MPTPQTPFSTAPMPSKHISPGANTSNPLFNSPHALKTHFTHCQHLKPPFQLTPCPRNTFHQMPTPQTPFSTAPMPSKHISLTPCPENIFHTLPTPQTPFSTAPLPTRHISPSANTSNPLFNSPHALKTHFTQCQHLKPPFQLPPRPENTFHPPVPTPQTPFSTHPMPSKHISHSANTSNAPFQLPPCPQNTFHTVPTPRS